MSDSKQAASGGIGSAGLLGVVFVTLKLCGVIHWSWWWVTCPFWGGLALVVSILILMGLGLAILTVCEHVSKKRHLKNMSKLRGNAGFGSK